MTERVQQYLEQHREDACARLIDWLSIASVSTDAAHQSDMQRGAQWAHDHLTSSGLDAKIMTTAGHPLVYAESLDAGAGGTSGGATVLFYGHYDVQPPDPLDLWDSPPFEPQVRDGNIFARGACDDKGQVACFLEALRGWHEVHGKLPCRVKVLLEGEEEIGSPNLPAFIEQHKQMLAADVCLISDTTMWTTPQGPIPAITHALRGLVYFDVQLHGPSRDLHSGVYGGTVANPATLLTRVIGRLLDDQQRITIPGFYDDVLPMTESQHADFKSLNFDDKAWLNAVGAKPYGVADYDTLARRWTLPSCDINGLYGGFMQEGAKTVIPAFAGVKVSFRIPANMYPKKVGEQFEAWLRSHDVGDCRWKITCHGQAHPVATPTDSPYIEAARRAVQHIIDQPPAMVCEGATIPAVADFKNRLDIDTLLLGFGLDSDMIHAPNEHFSLDRFELGCRVHAVLLNEIADIDD